MTTNAVLEPALQTNYLRRARKLLGECYARRESAQWLAADKLAEFIQSNQRLLAALAIGLPKEDTTIEDLKLSEDRVVVRYKSHDDPTPEFAATLSDKPSVSLSHITVLRLDDGSVIEHCRSVYQINLLSR